MDSIVCVLRRAKRRRPRFLCVRLTLPRQETGRKYRLQCGYAVKRHRHADTTDDDNGNDEPGNSTWARKNLSQIFILRWLCFQPVLLSLVVFVTPQLFVFFSCFCPFASSLIQFLAQYFCLLCCSFPGADWNTKKNEKWKGNFYLISNESDAILRKSCTYIKCVCKCVCNVVYTFCGCKCMWIRVRLKNTRQTTKSKNRVQSANRKWNEKNTTTKKSQVCRRSFRHMHHYYLRQRANFSSLI